MSFRLLPLLCHGLEQLQRQLPAQVRAGAHPGAADHLIGPGVCVSPSEASLPSPVSGLLLLG